MSLIKLKTKDEIKEFFKILAEESVKEAKKQVFSDDPMATKLSRLAAEDKKAYGLKEQGASSLAVTQGGSEDVDIEDVESVAEDLPEDEEVEREVEVVSDTDIEDVSLDAIEKKINVLRGGRSLQDREVERGLGRYFDLLSQAERKALYAFLTALSSLMTGESTGDEADDPSEPPYNVTMTSSGEETEEVEVSADLDTSNVQGDVAEEEVEEEADDVDNEESVPIRVGAVQESTSIASIRSKVQELLKRS